MKKFKMRTPLLICATVLLLVGMFSMQALADSKPHQVKMTVKKMTVYVGETFELKVKTTPVDADDDALKWSIVSGKKLVKFADADDERDGDDMEFKALKAGKAKICCQIKGTNQKTYAVITIKTAPKAKGTIKAVGSKVRTVEVGDDFELKVKKFSGVKNSHLKWYIKDKSIVAFEDDDITDDDVEFEARKVGTTKITCKNRKTKKSISFTIHVINDIDDDDDDDDDDD